MANKTIGQQPTLTAITENTLFLVENSGTTYNINYSIIKPYKIYKALISQSGTDDPTVIVLENTIGNIVWTRNNIGTYYGILSNTFTADKTFIPQVIQLDLYSGNAAYLAVATDNYVELDTRNTTSGPIDGFLYYTPILIEVYN